jgi:hypothetical protein
LPTPGPLVAVTAAPVELDAVLVVVALELLDEELLLPHAASPKLSATNASAAHNLPGCVLDMLRGLAFINCLLIAGFADRKG